MRSSRFSGRLSKEFRMRFALRCGLAALIVLVAAATVILYGVRPAEQAVASDSLVTTTMAVPPTVTSPPTSVATTTTTLNPIQTIEYATAVYNATSTTTTTAPPPPPTYSPTTRPPATYPQTTTTQAPPPPPPPPEPTPEPQQQAEEYVGQLPAFLACVRQRESGGNYQAVNRSSMAGGAYQYLRSTWASMGYAAKYGVPGAEMAAPWQQDQAAIDTLTRVGRSPWAGPYC